MSPAVLEVVIGVCTVVVSVAGSVFAAGARWGRVEYQMRDISRRLTQIERMFTLRLKGGPPAGGGRRD